MKKLLLGLGTIAAITVPVVSVVACDGIDDWEKEDVNIYVDTSDTKMENEDAIEKAFEGVDSDKIGDITYHIRFKNGITRELGSFRMASILNAKNYGTDSGAGRIFENIMLGATSWTITQDEMLEIIQSIPSLPEGTFDGARNRTKSVTEPTFKNAHLDSLDLPDAESIRAKAYYWSPLLSR